MTGYVINNNTLSFLQFDDPNDIFKDTITNSGNKWIHSGDLTQNKTRRVSKPFCLNITSHTSTNVGGETSYIKYDNYIEDSFTVDFWFQRIDIRFEIRSDSFLVASLEAYGSARLNSRNGKLEIFTGRNKVDIDYGEEYGYEKKWNHCAFTFNISTGEITFFYNGKKMSTGILETKTPPFSINFSSPVVYRDGRYLRYSWSMCYLDNIRITKGILWDTDFVPPGMPGHQIFVHGDNAYGVKNGSTILVSSNWPSLSNSDKAIKVQDLDYDVLPRVSDLIFKSSDGKTSTIESYQGNTETPNLVIKSSERKVETVYQNTLLDLSKFMPINKIVPDYTITNSSTIRVAITTDLLTYKTYNFNTSSWETIDNGKVVTDGIPINKLGSIPKNNLSELGSKIAFAYSIILDNSETDTCKLNSLSITVTNSDKWVKVKQTDQSYGYLNSKILQITFNKSGNYKVNYNNSNNSI